jgi:hypothetical protein
MRDGKWGRKGLLLAGTTLLLLACQRTVPEPAFAGPAQAMRYFMDLRGVLPGVTVPDSIVALVLADEADGPPPERPAGEEEEEPAPPEVPRPDDLRDSRHVAQSSNWAGAPQGGRGLCPCETDFDVRQRSMFFNADPRRPNPPDPDPGNGLFPAIWNACRGRIPEPPAQWPGHPCAEPCVWVDHRVDDWSLSRLPDGTWWLTCWKMRIYHCELGVEP